MKLTIPRFIFLALGLFLAVSFLGGSAFWAVIGLSKSLDIDGNANIVRAAPDTLGGDWKAYGGDGLGNRYSKASKITPANVASLKVAWMHRTGALEGRSDEALSDAAFETTPIFVEESLIFCTQFNQVISIDPASGEEKWRFDPKVPTDSNPANQYTCRGVSYWESAGDEEGGECFSRILMGTVDSRLIALDAKTGQKCSDFGKEGEVRIEPSISLRWAGEFQITSAPAIVGDVVVTGSAIGDNLRTKAPLGTVHAFNVRTGELKWHFNPIPQDENDPARSTWAGSSAEKTGHANVWSTIAVDAKRGLVFLPTSSPSPDYYGGNRVGDNRYANSVVALNGETGEVVWHFQTVHHDVWDYDVPAQPGLFEVWRDGKAHDVVAQVTKMGLVFVLDRDTGKPFLPIEERAVPQGAVDGEELSLTQPFPVKTPAIVPDRLDPSDAFGVTLWDKMACARQIEALRGDGLFTPPSLQGTLAYPFVGGGANWGSSAYDPNRNLVVVNMTNMAAFVRLTKKTGSEKRFESIDDGVEHSPMEGAPYAMARAPLLSPLGLPCSPPPWGVLAGVDISTGKIVWRKSIGTTEDIAPGGLAMDFGTPNFGGPITTGSGLIFIGATMDDYLRAFSTETGQELWKGRLPAGGQATPMTYEYKGKQYVVIAAGGASNSGTKQGDYVVAYALPE